MSAAVPILPGTGRWQAREAGLTEGAPSTTSLSLVVPLPDAGRI